MSSESVRYPYTTLGSEPHGEASDEWSFLKLKYRSQIHNGDSLNEAKKTQFTSSNRDDLPYISSKDITLANSSIAYDNGIRIPREADYKHAPAQSSLICIEGGSAGRKVAYTEQEACFVNKLACIKSTNQADPKFIFYLLKSHWFQREFFRSMTGLIGGVSISSIKNIKLPFPRSIEKQKSIVNFLDKKTSQIDQLIEIKGKQIELLEERKKIIIQNAVTRGINSDASMKDCDVDWVREVPAHWEVKRFKYLFSQSQLPVRKGDGVVTAYRDGQVTLRSNRRLTGYTEAILEHGFQGIRVGQLVLNSMDAFEGAIGVSESNGKCTPEYVVCDPLSENSNSQYFAYLLREMALANYIRVICNAVRQRAVRIRFSSLANQFLIVPPISEQLKINVFIEKESQPINEAIIIQKKQIENLKEYKASLINGSITGKIKVT